jgi:hypothetical protein
MAWDHSSQHAVNQGAKGSVGWLAATAIRWPLFYRPVSRLFISRHDNQDPKTGRAGNLAQTCRGVNASNPAEYRVQYDVMPLLATLVLSLSMNNKLNMTVQGQIGIQLFYRVPWSNRLVRVSYCGRESPWLDSQQSMMSSFDRWDYARMCARVTPSHDAFPCLTI